LWNETQQKGTSDEARTLKNPSRFFTLWRSPLYVVPFGMSRGVLKLFVMARKIAVSFVMAWFVGAVAWQPLASSE
jgi:hypothetical protein